MKWIRTATIILIASILQACGGGNSDRDPSAQVASVDGFARRLENTSDVARTAAITPILPADVNWARESSCESESDFILIDQSVPDDRSALLSRHVSCHRMVSNPFDVMVYLMRRADDSGWELYKASAGRPAVPWVMGRLTLSIKNQVYGPGAGLFKTYKLDATVISYIESLDFPLRQSIRSGYTMVLEPQVDCRGINVAPGISAQRCENTQPKISIPLKTGQQVATRPFRVNFAWSHDPSLGSPNIATFVVGFPYAKYSIVGADSADPFSPIPLSSASGREFTPQIRCDIGVAASRADSSGCVLPEAAAVLVMDASIADPAAEAAQHIYDAQRRLQPGADGLAPGVYTPLAGTRAVAANVSFLGSQFNSMRYIIDESVVDANRQASCDRSNSSSLINTRPYVGSAQCPTLNTAGCSCDEFPFASTREGASNYPGWTSVRGIQASHNSAQGGQYGGFLIKQRIIPNEYSGDDFWVYVKNAAPANR